MRTEGCEAQTLRALASMPFLDRTEMVAVTGWSKAAVHEAVDKLDSGGFCAAVPHATALFPSATQRFHLTAAGLGRLAEEEEASLDELVGDRPVSAPVAAQPDGAARLSRRDLPAGGRRSRRRIPHTVPVVQGLDPGRRRRASRRPHRRHRQAQGLTADRTGFSNRMWRLRQGPLPGAVLVLMADDVRLRHVRRTLAGAPVPFYLALEREAVAASPDDPVWSPSAVSASVELRSVLDRIEKGSLLPEEDEPRMVSVPADLSVEGPGWKVPDYLLPATLKPAEKRALDLISDWPWITPDGPGRNVGRLGPPGLPAGDAPRRVPPRHPAHRRERAHGPHRPGPGPPGPQGPDVRGRREEAVERRSPVSRHPVRLGQRDGREEPPAAQERRAHRRRPLLPCSHDRAGGTP